MLKLYRYLEFITEHYPKNIQHPNGIIFIKYPERNIVEFEVSDGTYFISLHQSRGIYCHKRILNSISGNISYSMVWGLNNHVLILDRDLLTEDVRKFIRAVINLQI